MKGLGSAAALLLASTVWATGPVVWIQAGRDLAAGTADRITVTESGELLLAPASELLFDTGSPRIWSIAISPDGTVYVAAGEEGKVFQVRPGEAPTPLFEASELGAQAMAWGPDGHLYVATGPRGSVYRVPPDHDGSQLEPWFTPEATYVWSLVFNRDGVLYVATGGDGKIWRVTTDGTGTVLYDSRETHVRALAIDSDGNVIAGTADNGHIYRITPAGEVFVLYDAPVAEITSLVVVGNEVWAGGFGAGTAPGGGPPPADNGQAATVPAAGPGASNGRTAGAIYRIHADGYSEQVWTSSSQGVHSLARFAAGVIAGTGPEGQLVYVNGSGTSSRLVRLEGAQVVALRQARPGEMLAATSNLGKVYWLRDGFGESGEYLSQVKDTGETSRWGEIRWHGDTPPGTTLEIATRSGNTAVPDDTWSDWSPAYESSTGSAVGSPAARFLQWRAALTTTDATRSATLYRVEVAYVPRNSAPVIGSFRVHPAGVVYRQTSSFEDGMPFAQVPHSVARALREADAAKGNGAAAIRGRAFLGRPLFVAGLQTFTWEVSDPNDDELRYRLEFRGEDESVWKPMADGLTETLYSYETNRVPDGAYVARLTADDLASNPAPLAREVTQASSTFVIDNTAPDIVDLSASVDGTTVHVTARVREATSLIRQIEYSADGTDWHTVLPADGVVDSTTEDVDFTLVALEAGEHTVVLRVTDTALNASAGKVVFVTR